jgi:predicted amidophosphoribosyltransferase
MRGRMNPICPRCGQARVFDTRRCPVCKKPFAVVRADKICCSLECSAIYNAHTYYLRVIKPRRQAAAAKKRAAKKGKRK